MIATYVLASLLPYSGWDGVLIVAVGSTGAVVALVSAEARAGVVRLGIVLAVAAVALATIGRTAHGSAPYGVAALIQVALFILAVGGILRAVITEPEVDAPAILGAISVYVILGLLFTFVYAGVDRFQSGHFFGKTVETGDLVWFSITTLTTTGYGTLVPAAQPGKMLTGLEMLIGQIFLVTLVAGLVSLWRPGGRARGRAS